MDIAWKVLGFLSAGTFVLLIIIEIMYRFLLKRKERLAQRILHKDKIGTEEEGTQESSLLNPLSPYLKT
jgi:hypothetical protein